MGKGHTATKPMSGADCSCCRHCHCIVCEECSAAKQYPDYWICHRCRELNPRVPNLVLKRRCLMDWEKIKPVLWGAVGGAILLATIGFNWGGWVTTGTAEAMAKDI